MIKQQKLEVELMQGRKAICASCHVPRAINPDGAMRKHNCRPRRGRMSNETKRLMSLQKSLS